MSFCKKCGKQIEDNVKYCPGCGTPVSETESSKSNPDNIEISGPTLIRNKPSYGAVNPEDLPEGFIIDNRYEIKKKLGQGGFGAVYRAYDRVMNVDKALKIIPDMLFGDRESMEYLRREASVMVKLNHPNIVRAYDFHESGAIKYIDMEYVDGQSLSEIKLDSPEKRIPEKRVVEFAAQIAEGMAYAHLLNVIHRDIKPQNVMLDKSGKIKIMDFGIAETVRSSVSRVSNKSLTGTVVYMSPEQIRGQDIGKESDVYSFGVMLYELLSGKPPFYQGAIEHQILNEQPKPLSGVSQHVNSLVMKCLEKDYRKRSLTFAEIGKKLREPVKKISTDEGFSEKNKQTYEENIRNNQVSNITKKRMLIEKKLNSKSFKKFVTIFLLSIAGLTVISAYPAFLLARYTFNRYFEYWGDKLVSLEKHGLLSKVYGAGWQDVLMDEEMANETAKFTGIQHEENTADQQIDTVEGVIWADYPSLSIIDKLREIKDYSSTIQIVDRMERPLNIIKTEHKRARIYEFPPTLIKALVAAEDKDFRGNKMGFDFGNFINGTSTITLQVADFLISNLDDNGMRQVSQSVDRKIRKMRLAVALRKMYSPDDILEVYLNYCVTSDFGMVGIKDIARGFFNKNLDELSDAQCIYLARLAKWGSNDRSKIIKQCRTDMPAMGEALGWDEEKQRGILDEIDTMSITMPRQIEGEYGPFVDLAAEFGGMDLLNPNSLIRKKGNMVIRLSIDLPLQQELESLVNARGYGGDAVNGQYYAYSIMDSRTGELLAYYSKDTIGSRLAGLLQNRTPNGASVAEPIFNAINFDIDNFKPYSKWSDLVNVTGDAPWRRTVLYQNNNPIGVEFQNCTVQGSGYQVYNNHYNFEGCRYIFDLLASSNNILGVETAYRLNRRLFDGNGEVLPDAFPLVQLFYRIGSFSRIKDSLHLNSVTGVRVYKELVRIVGADIDSTVIDGNNIPISDKLYSVALGTLNLSLYQQMHLFNVLYNNDLIENPADHPSLAIKSITLYGDTMPLNDTILRYHPFSDVNSIRPTLLGLHKCLVSDPSDELEDYDNPYTPDRSDPVFSNSGFTPDAYTITEPLSNFAKSGTTDDIIRPFNVDASSTERTNYGLWNAVIRVDLSKFSDHSMPDIHDITIACIGECNSQLTGNRDGKTLHKFVTSGLLAKAGLRAQGGFFSQYERYIKRFRPSEENCGN